MEARDISSVRKFRLQSGDRHQTHQTTNIPPGIPSRCRTPLPSKMTATSVERRLTSESIWIQIFHLTGGGSLWTSCHNCASCTCLVWYRNQSSCNVSLTVHNAEYCSSEALQVIVAELPPRTTKQSKLAPHTTQLASCTATTATSVLNPKQRR